MRECGKEWLGCLLGAGEGGRGRGKELRVLLKLFKRVSTVYLICWRCRRTVVIPVQSPIPPVTAYGGFPRDDAFGTKPVSPKP